MVTQHQWFDAYNFSYISACYKKTCINSMYYNASTALIQLDQLGFINIIGHHHTVRYLWSVSIYNASFDCTHRLTAESEVMSRDLLYPWFNPFLKAFFSVLSLMTKELITKLLTLLCTGSTVQNKAVRATQQTTEHIFYSMLPQQI